MRSRLNISAPLANYSWTAQTSVVTITISNAASVSITLTNNNTAYSLTDTAQCTQVTGDAGTTLTLYRNGTQVASGTTPIQEQTVLPAGFWNYTCVYPATLDYSTVSNASWMLVNKTVPTLILNNGTASVNTSGLVGYWRFEEGSGTTVGDSSGWSNIGTIYNSPNVTWSTGCKFGSCLTFNSTGLSTAGRVQIPNSQSLNISGTQITIETWVKPYNATPEIPSEP